VAGEIELDWDENNIRHIAEHGLTFHDVEDVVRGFPVDIANEVVGSEERTTVLGHTRNLRVIYVVFTMRGEQYRRVTAFPAKRSIQAKYWKATQQR